MSTPSQPILISNYVRWGRTVCPCGTGAKIAYSGRAAGSSHSDSGGGANMLCLPDNPDYLSRTSDSVEGDYTALTGAEFHTWVAREDHKAYPSNCPGVVSYVPRATTLMIPAKIVCP